MPGIDQHQIGVVRIGRQTAQPGELQRVENRRRVALDRQLRHRAAEAGDDGAIALRHIERQAIGGDQPAGAGQVLHHDR